MFVLVYFTAGAVPQRTDRFTGTLFSKATGPNMMINISRLDDDQVSCLASGCFRTGLLLLLLTWLHARIASKWSYCHTFHHRLLNNLISVALITFSLYSGMYAATHSIWKNKKRNTFVFTVFCGGQWCVSGLTTTVCVRGHECVTAPCKPAQTAQPARNRKGDIFD